MRPEKFPGFLLANLLFSLLIGYWLDSWLHTTPVFIVIGVLYAVVGSIVILLYKKKNG